MISVHFTADHLRSRNPFSDLVAELPFILMHPKPEYDDDDPINIICGDAATTAAAKRHGSRTRSIQLSGSGGGGIDGDAAGGPSGPLSKEDTSHNLIQLDA